MPHDAASRSKTTGRSYADVARDLGLKVEIVPIDQNEMFGIEAVRNTFPRMWFDQSKCDKGLKAIDAFKKEWNEKLGCYREKSLHDWASHGAKALIYGVEAIQKMSQGKGLSADEWRRLRRTV